TKSQNHIKYVLYPHRPCIELATDTAPPLQVFFAAEKIYIIGSGLVKISILLFYRQLAASSTKKVFIYLVNASVVFTI
ncbi:hypothetical protein RCK50_24075, partial [Salmonella enterica subsp. enterica serovar Derby]